MTSSSLSSTLPSATAFLIRGAGRQMKAGGAWIYDNEIDRVEGNFENGSLVRVADYNGYPLGTGFINENSVIRIRLMTRDPEQPIDEAFLRARVRAAIDYRLKVADMNACRLIFGEADFLPGFVADKFADILVIQALAMGIDRMKDVLVRLIQEELAASGYPLRGVYERSDAKERDKEGLERQKGFLGPEFDTKVPIVENGVKYLVDVKDGQKTGFFLDQKENRRAIQRLCKGARVLDCFTHTGSFALNAGLAGAREVLGVDASDLAIRQAEENAALNGLSDTVKFEVADVLDLLPQLVEQGEQYDVVILDPPAFTKSRHSVKNAERGYREINRRGLQLVRNGGFLATCSCSHFMTPELFTDMIAQAARSAHVRLRQVEYRTQAADHPILWSAEESYYLKFYIFQVVR